MEAGQRAYLPGYAPSGASAARHQQRNGNRRRPIPGPLHIKPARFERALRELAHIGADPGGGLSRLGLSQEEARARAYLSTLAQRADLAARTDPAGNLLVGRRNPDPDLPVLLFGSHLDTVRQGGWLDGSYGVVAALEVLTVLTDNALDCRYEPMVAGFANEEGALVQYPFWGSRALTGTAAGALEACDRQGIAAAGYLRAAGGDPERLAEAAWPQGSAAAFIELHIEQGPTLEQRSLPIGVVDRITGRAILEFTVIGEAGHAGTTSMDIRRDALSATARLIVKIESLASPFRICSTATVGFLEVSPNVTNTIPGLVRLTAEIRDGDTRRLRNAVSLLSSMAAHVAQETGTRITMQSAHRSDPVVTDPHLRAAVAEAAASLGLDHVMMTSRAGHDAQVLATICPVGMIFVPSEQGQSHVACENTAMPALIAGADVLLNTIISIEQYGLRH